MPNLHLFTQATAAWSNADIATTVRLAFLALLVPQALFTIVAVAVEQRAGRRGLRTLWAGATALLLVYIALNALLLPVRERIASTIGVVPFVILGSALFAVSFAFSAAAVAATGSTSQRPRAQWVRGIAGVAAGSVGTLLVLAAGVALEAAGVL